MNEYLTVSHFVALALGVLLQAKFDVLAKVKGLLK